MQLTPDEVRQMLGKIYYSLQGLGMQIAATTIKPEDANKMAKCEDCHRMLKRLLRIVEKHTRTKRSKRGK